MHFGQIPDTFLATWRDWDAHPSNQLASTRMEDSCHQLARTLNTPVTVLRDELGRLRRQGFSRRAVLEAVCGADIPSTDTRVTAGSAL